MKIVDRKYLPGDEHQINRLYQRITGIIRSESEYRWEWINTWKGQGSIWLMFDKDRESKDQLVGQYSLIPTPFSFWGAPFLAGKTENCMCHPDYRSKGIYFTHEKECFQDAKNIFDMFFTTTGDVSGGAVGAIRRKLGYTAFDSWSQYVYVLNNDAMNKKIKNFLAIKSRLKPDIIKQVSKILSKAFVAYFKIFNTRRRCNEINILNKDDVPLDLIEEFWNKNRTAYGITVERSYEYLNWRINKNPYFEYSYLTYMFNGRIAGYIIFYMPKDGHISISDIIADNKDPKTLPKKG